MAAQTDERDSRRYWVGVTGPDYYLDEDGAERRDLDPGSGYEPGGWWTCHWKTEAGDLVLLYRSQKKREGPRVTDRNAACGVLASR
jgi:hypothetical protein